MKPFTYLCPYCNMHTTATDEDCSIIDLGPYPKGVLGMLLYEFLTVVCPNPDCKREQVRVMQYKAKYRPGTADRIAEGGVIEHWRLLPRSGARPYPTFVPKAIRDDYNEACAIVDLSPKASATLSRRALQGIMRDFFQAKGSNLKEEIEAAEKSPLMPPGLGDALHAVRELGNIGAHMEKDINLIIDVEPDEANALIQLIETLLEETYVARDARGKRVAAVKATADAKKSLKAATAGFKPPPRPPTK